MVKLRLAAFIAALPIAQSCLVSFEDYPVGDLAGNTDSGASGSGGLAGSAGSGAPDASAGEGGSDASQGGSAPGGAGGSAGTAATGTRGRLVVNEIDYDQPATDRSEFVEIYNASTNETADLAGIAIVFVNGAASVASEYQRISLSGSLAPESFVVVAGDGVTVAPGARVIRFSAPDNNIQNDQDAVAIFDIVASEVLDALSYEGAVSGAIDGVGSFDFVEGTQATAEDTEAQQSSLVRLPDGADTNNAETDWSLSTTPTPGAPNQQ
jgi:hypothetical protein